MTDLTGKIVLITGATDGLGRGVAISLAQRGATLLVHGRDRARGEAVVREIRAVGSPEVRLYVADLNPVQFESSNSCGLGWAVRVPIWSLFIGGDQIS